MDIFVVVPETIWTFQATGQGRAMPVYIEWFAYSNTHSLSHPLTSRLARTGAFAHRGRGEVWNRRIFRSSDHHVVASPRKASLRDWRVNW
jgi:hypothetical protein